MLKAYGLRKNDEILLPAYTCETLGRLLINMGFVIKFVDIDKKTYNLSIDDLQKKISKNTKAVIPVHMYGIPCDIFDVLDISHDKKAIVIEDAAQAMGAEQENKKIGTLGDSGFFSLGLGKPITTLGGGIIVTENTEIARKCRNMLITFKKPKTFFKIKFLIRLISYHFIQEEYIYKIIYTLIESRREKRRQCLKEGFNTIDIGYKYTNMQAMLGINQLNKLDTFNDIRQKNAEYLIRNLAQIPGIKTPNVPKKSKSIYLRLPIWIEDITYKQRDELINELKYNGIDASVAYPNSLPYFFGLDMNRFPNTEERINKTITLPTNPLVKNEDMNKIIYIIKRYCIDSKK